MSIEQDKALLHRKKQGFRGLRAPLSIMVALLVLCGWSGQHAGAKEPFLIKGYYLGATPEDLGIELVSEDEEGGPPDQFMTPDFVTLFFVRVGGKLRVYRIIKEEVVEEDKMDAALEDLVQKHGIPELQHIDAAYIKTSPKMMRYVLSAKNKATWKVSATQDFITWIEKGRIVYELLDNDPQKHLIVSKPEATGKGATEGEKPEEKGWDQDL